MRDGTLLLLRRRMDLLQHIVHPLREALRWAYELLRSFGRVWLR